MDKRKEAILEWVRENRPDLEGILEDTLLSSSNRVQEVLAAYMYIAFEAGRQFQHDTGAELEDANIYWE